MSYVLNDHVVLLRPPEGPLAPYLAGFAASLQQQGYSPHYLHRQVMLAADFSRWLQRRGTGLRRIAAKDTTHYLQSRRRRRLPREGDGAALAHLIDFLRGERVLPAAKPAPRHLSPADVWVQAYAQYLREDRGLAEATIRNYAPFIDRWLAARFGAGPVSWRGCGRATSCGACNGRRRAWGGSAPNC